MQELKQIQSQITQLNKNFTEFQTLILSEFRKLTEQMNSRFDNQDIRLNNVDERLNRMESKLDKVEEKVDVNSRKLDWIFSGENDIVTEERLKNFARINSLAYE